ncbi:hypothetical protein [Massilia sp. Dwa41.01b]|uniref:hypothetical protein n=1 Tax=Massilia sp. Dwa41.01b TaxID=2709302 RepID=UPI001E462684|nr:hypothetical protein [Massilia sp. Dwa41.01b]
MFDSLDFGPHLDVAARSALGVGELQRAENQDNCVLIDAAGNAACLVEGGHSGAAFPAGRPARCAWPCSTAWAATAMVAKRPRRSPRVC